MVVMNKEQFAKLAKSSGYGTPKQIADYIKKNPKTEYTEKDFVKLYETYNMKFRDKDNKSMPSRKTKFTTKNLYDGYTTAFDNYDESDED